MEAVFIPTTLLGITSQPQFWVLKDVLLARGGEIPPDVA
jgi:hypothetical protein